MAFVTCVLKAFRNRRNGISAALGVSIDSVVLLTLPLNGTVKTQAASFSRSNIKINTINMYVLVVPLNHLQKNYIKLAANNYLTSGSSSALYTTSMSFNI